MIEFMKIIVVLVVLIPLSTFLSVKLGTYAFYKGRSLALLKTKELHHG